MSEQVLRGVGAASGVALGRAFVYRSDQMATVCAAGDPGTELARYRAATASALRELDRLGAGVSAEAAAILAAHRLMLADPELQAAVEAGVASGQSADAAVSAAFDRFADMLAGIADEYLRQRSADVRDVGRRLLAALAGRQVGLKLSHPRIVIARDLAPSDTIGVDRSLLLGIVTEQGGPTSHTCILARAWGIPAVVATAGVLERVADGSTLALDGGTGEVVLDPSPETVHHYEGQIRSARERLEADHREADLPAETRDGRRLELAANAGSPAEVVAAMAMGADGIGLLRSEFLFMGRASAPTEAEQYEAYTDALRAAAGRRVIIRTLDIGGDKDVPYLGLAPEANPFLGNRALRLCLQRPDLFRTQLRALLRAGVHGRLAIMFPMVGDLTDLQRARAALDAARQSLVAEGLEHLPHPEVGIMIEIPSAALMASHLAPAVDFFSIGTNDLVQYTLAVDRTNPQLASLYTPLHPAVLQLIATVVAAAHDGGKWVGVCGEMASDPAAALLLLGLGVDELSVSASAVAAIRRLIRGARQDLAQAMGSMALRAATPEAVRALTAAQG